MKVILFLLLIGGTVAVQSCNNEKRKLLSKIQTMPSFDALELDSSTVFNTTQLHSDKPTIIIYFDPDCHTCQEETKMITKYIADLAHTQILMLSMSEINQLRDFVRKYELQHYSNIRVAKDHKYSMLNIFKLKQIPSAVLYNDKGEIAKIYEGAPSLDEIKTSLSIQ